MTATCPVCDAPQDEGLLCSTDTARLERALGDVPALVAELDTTISRQAKIGQAGKGGPAHERTPVHVGAMNVADDLQNTLTTWARDVGTYPQYLVTNNSRGAAHILLREIDAIRRHPTVAEPVDEITDAISQARRVVDRPADRQYLGQCLFEDESGVTCYEDIYAPMGADETRCRVCGITHEVGERRKKLMDRAEDMYFTAGDAAKFLGYYGNQNVSEDRIRGYLRRNRVLMLVGTNTFRLGDLLDVLADDTRKRESRRSA